MHACNMKESQMCGIEIVIEELFYPKEAANQQAYKISLNLGNELAEQTLIEYQDTAKVMGFYINNLKGKYSMKKTTRNEKED